MEINVLIDKLKEYNPDAIYNVVKAYEYAKYLHEGQYRQSGEPYILHPLHVAYILAELHADCDTICAGLLHDTLEDTGITKEDIAHHFNCDVANLVDGVTKINRLSFTTKEEQQAENLRKMLIAMGKDIRVIIIKLADRLHNMRTLSYMAAVKQKKIAQETIDIFEHAKTIFSKGLWSLESAFHSNLMQRFPSSAYEAFPRLIDFVSEVT